MSTERKRSLVRAHVILRRELKRESRAMGSKSLDDQHEPGGSAIYLGSALPRPDRMLATLPVWGCQPRAPAGRLGYQPGGRCQESPRRSITLLCACAQLDAARSRAAGWAARGVGTRRGGLPRADGADLARPGDNKSCFRVAALCTRSYGTGSRAGTALHTALCSSTLRTISFTSSAMGRSCVSMRCPSCAALRAISA